MVVRKYDRKVALDQFQETARNTYEVRYSFCGADDNQTLLTFILTGDDIDIVLLQDNQPAGRESPGQVDQRVYRLDEMDDLKRVVQDKIITHLNMAT